ncbi:unnamed protein product, partial [Symbiodinium sp. CCMP2456]
AWRYPCYTATDVQLFEAIVPPPGAAVGINTITYSDQGHGNTLMAGGDLDGDHVMVSFTGKLVAIVRGSQAGVRRLAPVLKSFEDDILESVHQSCSPWRSDAVAERGREYIAHAANVSSYNVRGKMCGLLERVLHVALEEGGRVVAIV